MSNSSNNPSYAIIEACHPSIGIIDKKDETVKSRLFFCLKKLWCTTATRPRHTGTAPCGCGCPRSADVLSARGTPPFFLYLLQKGAEPIPSRPLPVGRGGATQSNSFVVLGCLVLSHSWYISYKSYDRRLRPVCLGLPSRRSFPLLSAPQKITSGGAFCVAGLPIIPP